MPRSNSPDGFDQTIDLDAFLAEEASDGSERQATIGGIAMPESDRMVVCGILLDDSGSMRDGVTAVRDGLKLAVAAFRGAKGSDFYLQVGTFTRNLFRGALKDIGECLFLEGYSANLSCTPLVAHSVSMLEQLRQKAQEYRRAGIPTTVAMLILTDGRADDRHESGQFCRLIENGDYIVGMGIRWEHDPDYSTTVYQRMFRDMGITHIVTPSSDPAEVRHAINQFSQSVASIAVA